jgi:hypothetical protein
MKNINLTRSVIKLNKSFNFKLSWSLIEEFQGLPVRNQLENYFKALQYENTYKIEKGRLQGKIKLKSAILALQFPCHRICPIFDYIYYFQRMFDFFYFISKHI